MDDLALHGFHKRGIFPFGVYNNHIGVRVGEDNARHFLLRRKGLSRTRHAEDKGIAVQKVAAVGDNHIFADNILPVIHAVLMVDFLHTERDKHRKALRGEGTQGINLPHAERQGGIQSVHLLIFQHGKLAEMLSCCCEQGFGVIVKLLFGISRMHHREDGKHHPLVTGRQIVQKFLAFLSLLLQVIGDNSGKVVVLVLFPLPVGDIGFHTQKTVFHLPHGFVRRDGNDIDGEHHITVQFTKLRHHAVLDIGGVLSEENHTPVPIAHLEIILFKLKGVGADIVLEVVTFPHRLGKVERKRRFLACAVEVMEDTQLVIGIKLRTL